jgi:hypothetical protein
MERLEQARHIARVGVVVLEPSNAVPIRSYCQLRRQGDTV